jgi:hypothetical protein
VLGERASGAFAADPAYRLDVGAAVRNGMLTVEPEVAGPAGAELGYEIVTRKEGAGGNSNSSQSGNVRLGASGQASLASTSVSVAPEDRYRIQVKVREGGRVVAEQTVVYPR